MNSLQRFLLTADLVRGVPLSLLHYLCINKPARVRLRVCLFAWGREGDGELKRRSGAHTEEEGGRENEDAWALHKENIILLPSPTLTDVISNGEKCRYKKWHDSTGSLLLSFNYSCLLFLPLPSAEARALKSVCLSEWITVLHWTKYSLKGSSSSSSSALALSWRSVPSSILYQHFCPGVVFTFCWYSKKLEPAVCCLH